MPAIQRRGGRIGRPGRIMNPLEILNYVVQSAGDPRTQDEELYRANRAQLLAKGVLTDCQAFWQWESDIPAELKPGADPDYEAEWTDEYGHYPDSERQKEARRLWLTLHPREA